MQTTILDPSLTQALAAAREPGLTLIIGNKNYSSWSMRPWVAMTAFGIPFQEVRVLLDQQDTATKIAAYSACGRVPVLLAGEMTIWDSLAICEYLAEQFPDKHLWPQDVAARAMARCVCAEMHSGFTGLRTDMSMNIKAKLPGRGRTAAAQADIGPSAKSGKSVYPALATTSSCLASFPSPMRISRPSSCVSAPMACRWRRR